MEKTKVKKAQICLFVFNRLAETKKTVEALQSNFLAEEYHLNIFSDGPRSLQDQKKIQEVRDYVNLIEGFKSIKVLESDENKGLAKSIIDGVSQVLKLSDCVIVLEDDLVTSPNFLDFMEQALSYYEDDKNVISISGFTFNMPSLPGEKDYYFGYRASSWGWAVWKDRWNSIDWEISDYKAFIKNKEEKKRFKKGGSDLVRMLRNQMNGKIDSWAIRFCYNQFKSDLKTVFPTISKVSNIGFGEDATHTTGATRFRTKLDVGNKRNFHFDKFSKMDKNLVKEFSHFFSSRTIILDKLISFIRK
ncbi:glycosyltransferase [Maribacter confluentis]|uniref:Glycosyltransferase n=1 Tax=Maribacter confluentis TaxID=1656093 RepID=A0ABT8RRZ3_9FLAO|nr:glycosyltransferase [Maribacter confluentis]MDO1513694.1 glycosyltransferase [Maribacter confluentis]